MYLRINELWSLSKAGAWPHGVAPGSLAVLLGSTVVPAPLTPVVAPAQEDGSRAGKRALAPSQQIAGTISDPFSSSWKTRLSSPCREPPSHTCSEVRLKSSFLELVYSSLYVLGMGCQGLSPAPGGAVLCSHLDAWGT